MFGQTRLTMPAATPSIPPKMDTQRIAGTRLAITSCVMPPNNRATPTNVASTTKLPTLYDSRNIPIQIQRAPSATSQPHLADASRAPARAVSRSRSGVFTALVICRLPLGDARSGGGVDISCLPGVSCVRRTAVSWPRVRGGLLGCGGGECLGVGAGVDGVEHRQLCVLDRPAGEVEGLGRVSFCPVCVVGGELGVHLAGPLVDVRLDIARLG